MHQIGLKAACLTTCAALLLGIGAAGCGSSDSTDTTTTAITKSAFVAQANAICTKGNKVQSAAGAKLGKNPSQAQFTAYTKDTVIPNIQGQIDSVRALGAPAGDEATVSHMLDLAQADLNKIKADPTLLQDNSDQFANFAKIAHPYGLTACDPNNPNS